MMVIQDRDLICFTQPSEGSRLRLLSLVSCPEMCAGSRLKLVLLRLAYFVMNRHFADLPFCYVYFSEFEMKLCIAS